MQRRRDWGPRCATHPRNITNELCLVHMSSFEWAQPTTTKLLFTRISRPFLQLLQSNVSALKRDKERRLRHRKKPRPEGLFIIHKPRLKMASGLTKKQQPNLRIRSLNLPISKILHKLKFIGGSQSGIDVKCPNPGWDGLISTGS